MTMQIRMTAIRENEIVTLRGGACLVGAIAKIAIDCQKSPKLKSKTLTTEDTKEHGGKPSPQRRGDAEEVGHWDKRGRESSRRFPQMTQIGNNSAQDGPGSST